MKQANLHSYNLVINFQCPYCNLFTLAANNDIPYTSSMRYTCMGCDQDYIIPRVSVKIKGFDEEPQIKTASPKVNSNYDLALRGLQVLGWSKMDAKQVLSKIQTKNPSKDFSTEELIKLASNESA